MHNGKPVFFVAYRSDRSIIIMRGGRGDGKLDLITVKSEQEPPTLIQFSISSDFNMVAFSPDFRLLAMASGQTDNQGGEVRLFAADDGRELARIPQEGSVLAIAFSPNGSLVATGGGDGTARLIATEGGRELTRLRHNGHVRAVAFSPDGVFLATASGDVLGHEGEARLIIVDSGRELARFPHGGPVRSVAFSPDSRLLATASEDGTARVVGVAEGREVARITHDDAVEAVAFSPDSKLLATVSGDVRLWSTDLDAMLRRLCAGPG